MRVVKIKLLTEMREGEYCNLIIDGNAVSRKVYKNKDGLFIKDRGKIYYERALTLGEEVSILWILAK